MASTVRDTALLLQAVAGYDDLDDRQLGAPRPSALPDYISSLPSPTAVLPLAGMKIGILKEGFASKSLAPDVQAVVESAISKFTELGAEVKEVSVPMHSKGGSLMHILNKMGSHQARQGRSCAYRGVYVNEFFEKLMPWEQSKWDTVHSFVQGTSVSGQVSVSVNNQIFVNRSL